MNCLVTGGAGFIGSHIADKLLEEGNRVIVIDDFSHGKEANLPKDNQLIVYRKSICDDLSFLRKEKIDVVFHLAALPRVQHSINNPWQTHHVNVNGTLNLLEYCRLNGVKRFVFSSSAAVYGEQEKMPLREEMVPNPISPYAMHKLTGEGYCSLYTKVYGMEAISLRYFNVFGPRLNALGDYACVIPKFINILDSGKSPVIHGDGEQTRDFIYVSDIVDANILAAKTENEACFGKVLNIGSGKGTSVNKIAEEIIRLTNKDIRLVYGPAKVEPRHSVADIGFADKALKWRPKVEFIEGLNLNFESLQISR